MIRKESYDDKRIAKIEESKQNRIDEMQGRLDIMWENIEKELKKSGLTMRQVISRLGTASSLYNSYISHGDIRATKFMALCALFDVEPDAMLSDDPDISLRKKPRGEENHLEDQIQELAKNAGNADELLRGLMVVVPDEARQDAVRTMRALLEKHLTEGETANA